MRPSPSSPHGEQSESGAAGAMSVDPDMVVILASLLCALISVFGLALLARCACRWPGEARTHGSSAGSLAPPARGLKKKAIEALPTVSFIDGGRRPSVSECAICLAEFLEGEELRVLPRCSHGFHVACIDAWLVAHASCPSCRAAIMAPGRCRRCGATGDLDVEHADADERRTPGLVDVTTV